MGGMLRLQAMQNHQIKVLSEEASTSLKASERAAQAQTSAASAPVLKNEPDDDKAGPLSQGLEPLEASKTGRPQPRACVIASRPAEVSSSALIKYDWPLLQRCSEVLNYIQAAHEHLVACDRRPYPHSQCSPQHSPGVL